MSLELTTDYSKIANKYDKNIIRHFIARDPYLEGKQNCPLRVLDLACGTGNYLASQQRHYSHNTFEWIGMDASPEMLRVAKEKGISATFIHASAEKLPFENETIDYIVCRFAFHHFADKMKALSEMKRVLKKNGLLRIENIDFGETENWWMYRYFPSSFEVDKKRFWQTRVLVSELEKLGFQISTDLSASVPVRRRDALAEAINRDPSQLNLISDEEYQTGLQKMTADFSDVSDEFFDSGLVLLNLKASRS